MPDLTDPEVWWRLANMTATLVTLVLVMVYASEKWDAWAPETRLLTFALCLALLAILTASTENLVRNLPVGARTGANTIVVGYTLIAFWVVRRADRLAGRRR